MVTPLGDVQPRTMSYDEAAAMLGVSRLLVRKLVETGRIRRARLGARVVLNREDVERLAVGERERLR